VKLLCIPTGEGGPSDAKRVSGIAPVMRGPSSWAGGHENIFGTPGLALSRATSPTHPSALSGSPQVIVLQYISSLPPRRYLASLPHSGVIRAEARTRSWRDRDEQQPRSFVWSPMRPANRLCPRRRSPTPVLSIWFACSPGRPLGTSFKLRRITGRQAASRIEEVAR
jgi:hypothetical protein